MKEAKFELVALDNADIITASGSKPPVPILIFTFWGATDGENNNLSVALASAEDLPGDKESPLFNRGGIESNGAAALMEAIRSVITKDYGSYYAGKLINDPVVVPEKGYPRNLSAIFTYDSDDKADQTNPWTNYKLLFDEYENGYFEEIPIDEE